MKPGLGMLWLDNRSNVNLAGKIEQAAKYFAEKYGHAPTLCRVSRKTAGEGCPDRLNGIRIEVVQSLPAHHFELMGEGQDGRRGVDVE